MEHPERCYNYIFISFFHRSPFEYNMHSISHVVVHLSKNNIEIYNFLFFLISLVAMYPCCKSCIETNLALLHYVTFIEPLTVHPIEALSFDSAQFANNSIKVIEAKNRNPFLLSEEHFFASVLMYKKTYRVQFDRVEVLSHEVLLFFL
jgi:hypothetical protein